MKIKKIIKKAFLCTLVGLLVLAIAVLSFFKIGFELNDYERYTPSINTKLSEAEMRSILQKGILTHNDYNTLYYQTGLTEIGIDSVLETGGVDAVLKFQKAYFTSYGIEHDYFAPFCDYMRIDDDSPSGEMVELQNGDIIISSSTVFSCWDVGHCAFVIDAEKGRVLEAVGIGKNSTTNFAGYLRNRPDYIVLRPNIDKDTVDKIVNYAKENLIGIPYDPTVGVLTRKYNTEIPQTQCAHIIWYAFMQFGYDIDSNGGMVVSPKNIVHSQYFDVVQVFGFDPDTLWN
ncbi:MAG: hypothetical protein J6B60_02810 [Clostridia bacterium]|nr:hypothetical protein [Clostridia bacterium]